MSLKQALADKKIETLVSSYYNPTHELFLTPSTAEILKKLKKSANVDGITTTDIENFRNYLTDISREREQRILRGKKRQSSFRQVTAECRFYFDKILLMSLMIYPILFISFFSISPLLQEIYY